jgi:hypothetical protein
MQLLNHKWIKILVALAAAGILISAILQLLTPPESAPTPTSLVESDPQTQRFEKITFIGPAPAVPSKLEVYKLNSFKQSQSVLDQVVQTFNLELSPHFDYTWVGEEYGLSFIPEENRYTLSRNTGLTSVESQTGTLTLTEVRNQARSFVEQFVQFPPEIRLSTHREQYYSGIYQLVPVENYAEADVVGLDFTLSINDHPVFFATSAQAPFGVLITPNGTITKFEWQPLSFTVEKLKMAESLSLEQALSNINQKNQATIIDAYRQTAGGLDLSQIKEANMRSAVIEYRSDETSGVLYPFYRLTGSAVDADGQSMVLEIITPAIKIKEQN